MDLNPLPFRMAPRTLEEVVGQEHIIGQEKLLRRLIETDKVSSIILYGPPGTGKTALARVIANSTKGHFEWMNASIAKVEDIRKVSLEAKNRKKLNQQKTILFLDEIHRFNKLQQDVLLPDLKNPVYDGEKKMGKGGYVKQDYMAKKKKYYEPKEIGYEKKIRDRMEKLNEKTIL